RATGARAAACSATSTCSAPCSAPSIFRATLGPSTISKRLAATYDKTLPQFALRWTLSNPVVGTALVGFREPAEVTENLGALGWAISAADLAEIDGILERHNCVTVPSGWLED